MAMLENNAWYTSSGLDIDPQQTQEPVEKIKVIINSIVGDFVSYNSKNNSLTFRVDKDLFFRIISEKFGTAVISYKNESSTIEWNDYNYSVRTDTETITITVEEKQNE